MFTKNNINYRNLEEQVAYLTEFHNVNQGLAEWGIKVVGKVSSADYLPDWETYTGEFGDAYAVGAEPPYTFYIWTRPVVEGGHNDWFNFGEISIVGPQGPAGETGATGATGASTKWETGPGTPIDTSGNVGDLFLNTDNGDVYQLDTNFGNIYWRKVGNIRGPQGVQGPAGPQGPIGETGPQGPKGDTGDVGGFINIWGQLANTDQLPLPSTLDNLTAAYLVEHTGGNDDPNDHYDLYIQAGETSDTAVWTNAGPFNAGTLVTVNGSGQNVWNADTKLDKITVTPPANTTYVYSKRSDGSDTYEVVGNYHLATAWTIPSRGAGGNIRIPNYVEGQGTNGGAFPEGELAVNKNFVDNAVSGKLDKQEWTGWANSYKIYAIKHTGEQILMDAAHYNLATKYTIPMRNVEGNIRIPDYVEGQPTDQIPAGQIAVNKNYVDGLIADLEARMNDKKVYTHRVTILSNNNEIIELLIYSYDNSQFWNGMAFNPSSATGDGFAMDCSLSQFEAIISMKITGGMFGEGGFKTYKPAEYYLYNSDAASPVMIIHTPQALTGTTITVTDTVS